MTEKKLVTCNVQEQIYLLLLQKYKCIHLSERPVGAEQQLTEMKALNPENQG